MDAKRNGVLHRIQVADLALNACVTPAKKYRKWMSLKYVVIGFIEI